MCRPAHLSDQQGVQLLLQELPEALWADGGYRGELIAWVQDNFQVLLDIVLRSDKLNGFVVLPKRWIVERTFAWFGRYRRLSKDYEQLLENSEGMIYLAAIRRLLNCLAPSH